MTTIKYLVRPYWGHDLSRRLWAVVKEDWRNGKLIGNSVLNTDINKDRVIRWAKEYLEEAKKDEEARKRYLESNKEIFIGEFTKEV